MLEIRKTREKALQDERFKIDEGSRGVDGIYAITGESHGYFNARLHALAAGKHVLEFGCGSGMHALELAEHAAAVTGIDISDVGISIGERHARSRGISNVDFHAMDAEVLQFPDDRFDLICGVGILHHLDLNRAYAELARTLARDGRAMFLEPLGYNPFINLYRRLTPKIRTPDEHPLLMRDLTLARRFFATVDIRYYYLTTLVTVPFARRPGGRHAVSAANALDRAIFKALPPLRKYAWMVVMEMSDPLKHN
ncbi:MAG: class I SAM-dependent methyltransferase [Candidatus Baltobacteraceae bacterium]